ncbi:hypothetical protein [Chamaesiphon sp. VAR_69_metabat_338]|uniref:hypothetical protein n=1 Tax=Chamaesiphon sp. VAR_69_metabat_338 TaxID=2964704 RepID=UPI00286E3C59|nr:hypothetical protein [Chamaesiphon sp. VAR_69_metabat_338]
MNYLLACDLSIGNWCEPRPRILVVSSKLTPTIDKSSIAPVAQATPIACPAKLSSLADLLVRDLPGYGNRILQQRRKRTDRVYSSIVTASVPELQPLPVVSREYSAQFPQAAATQVFITTLETQYTGNRSGQIQQFHWLFLAQTRQGWRLANIYTRTGGFPVANNLISPPIESSRTIVGEAIRIWLNDCYLGKLRK